MQRTLEPELLDSLPPNHPDALRNRRDLRIINRILGNPAWFQRTLRALLAPRERILEIGAGTGESAMRLASQNEAIDGLDLWPRPAQWPANHRWHVGDLRVFTGYRNYAAVIGSLIFHQFSSAELAALGHEFRHGPRVILASEPARRRSSQLLFRALAPLLGANHVSLHDAHVSIAAGFRENELPRALGLDANEWDIRCSSTALGAYRMIALRRSP